MDVVWSRGEATVQDVVEALRDKRGPAYTTVMTVMGRLADKQLLSRRKRGRAYVYAALRSRDELAGSVLQSVVRRLYHGAAGRAIAHLLEADERVDEAELERIERLIRSRREERDR